MQPTPTGVAAPGAGAQDLGAEDDEWTWEGQVFDAAGLLNQQCLASAVSSVPRALGSATTVALVTRTPAHSDRTSIVSRAAIAGATAQLLQSGAARAVDLGTMDGDAGRDRFFSAMGKADAQFLVMLDVESMGPGTARLIARVFNRSGSVCAQRIPGAHLRKAAVLPEKRAAARQALLAYFKQRVLRLQNGLLKRGDGATISPEWLSTAIDDPALDVALTRVNNARSANDRASKFKLASCVACFVSPLIGLVVYAYAASLVQDARFQPAELRSAVASYNGRLAEGLHLARDELPPGTMLP